MQISGFSGRSRQVPKELINRQIQRIRSIVSALPVFPILMTARRDLKLENPGSARPPTLQSALTLLSQSRRYSLR